MNRTPTKSDIKGRGTTQGAIHKRNENPFTKMDVHHGWKN